MYEGVIATGVWSRGRSSAIGWRSPISTSRSCRGCWAAGSCHGVRVWSAFADVTTSAMRPAVSFYCCFDAAGEHVQAVVAEVTNTPWGERHVYVLEAGHASGSVPRADFEKAMHVSPFMGMDHGYHVRASTPGRALSVHIGSSRAGTTVFDATLSLRRRDLTRASVTRATARYARFAVSRPSAGHPWLVGPFRWVRGCALGFFRSGTASGHGRGR